MPIEYKINILSELKAAGYSTYRLRKEKLLGEAYAETIDIYEARKYKENYIDQKN